MTCQIIFCWTFESRCHLINCKHKVVSSWLCGERKNMFMKNIKRKILSCEQILPKMSRESTPNPPTPLISNSHWIVSCFLSTASPRPKRPLNMRFLCLPAERDSCNEERGATVTEKVIASIMTTKSMSFSLQAIRFISGYCYDPKLDSTTVLPEYLL